MTVASQISVRQQPVRALCVEDDVGYDVEDVIGAGDVIIGVDIVDVSVVGVGVEAIANQPEFR